MSFGDRTRDFLWTDGKENFLVWFEFQPNGAADPLPATVVPGRFIAGVTRAAAGRWTVTMRENVRAVYAMVASARVASNSLDTTIQFGTVSNENTGAALSFIVRNAPGGTETDIAADPQNRISGMLWLRIGALP